MRKKVKHTAHPSKLTRFQTFQEMKSTPPAFPATKSLDKLKIEYHELVNQLKSKKPTVTGQAKKSNKKTSK